jgi:hypothetical protein
MHATWKLRPQPSEPSSSCTPPLPSLKKSIKSQFTPYSKFQQTTEDTIQEVKTFTTTIGRQDGVKLIPKKTRYKSSFSSSEKGVLKIFLKPFEDNEKRTIKFGTIEVYFY